MFDINDDVLADINKTFYIPPRPEILVELQEVMEVEEPVLADVGDVIAKDVAISGAILKLINSPGFGLARTVSDIKQAVMFLGFPGVYSLVQGLKLKQAFSSENSAIPLDRFWDDAEQIAQIALLIGAKVKSKVPGESLYTLGLFHDCGIPLMSIKYDDYKSVLSESQCNSVKTLPEIEESRYKTNHAVVGFYVATSWNLPKELCQLILRHHDREYLNLISGSVDEICYSVLKMAENIVHSEQSYISSSDWHYIKDSVLDCLGFSEQDYIDLKEDILDIVFV